MFNRSGKTVRDARKTVFDLSYEQLNVEQRKAVESIEGPVMVLAGPGTGKTQILTLRIANILRQTQLNAYNVLALTFTESAAANMRRRLISLIGQEAYGVSIYTFHGFANSVIIDFPYKFQFAKELQSIDEIDQIKIIESLIDKLSLSELRPHRAPYHYVREIIARISELKREYVRPSQLSVLAEEKIKELQNNKDNYHSKGMREGRIKAAIVEEIRHLTKNIELSSIYSAYEEQLQERGYYDYDDMILFVIKGFESDSELKAYFQERYQYILVDEYQDTNSAQNKLLNLLTDYFDNPNLFVVGDNKQSIFRFQGAAKANLSEFSRRYKQAKIIYLNKNYRSLQPILDYSHQLINPLEQGQSRLVAHRESGSGLDRPIINQGIFTTTEVERYWIVKKIKALIEDGVAPTEIAIIYKENKEAEPLAMLLSRFDIPYTLERGSNVLLDIDTKRLVSILRAIAEPTNSQAIFSYLHYDFSGVNGNDLLKLMSVRAKKHLSIIDLLTNLPCEHNENELEKINFTDCQAFHVVIDKLSAWRMKSEELSLPELTEKVIRESGLLSQVQDSNERLIRLHRLRRFFKETERFARRSPIVSLTDFLAHLDLLMEHGIQLIPEPLELGEGTGGVKLVTAHKAKGLEFSQVFIPNLIDKHWGNDKGRKLIKLPREIINQVEDEVENADHRRLFYVAMTRAKDCLYLTYARSNDGQEQLPSIFLETISTDSINQIDTREVEKEAEERLLSFLEPIRQTDFSEAESEQIRAIIMELPITPTALNNYLRCPRGYFLKHILRVPTAKTASQGYGSAIHRALQLFFTEHRLTKSLPKLEELIGYFKEALTSEILIKREQEAFLEQGAKVLTDYYGKLEDTQPTVAVEHSFANRHLFLGFKTTRIPVTGVLDRVELIETGSAKVRVIDYKTGRARSRNEIEGKTKKADLDYRRQLIFYKMLTELDSRWPYQVSETALAFIDDDCRFPVEVFQITHDEVEDLKQLIRNVYSQMLTLEFPHIEDPLRPPCELCNL